MIKEAMVKKNLVRGDIVFEKQNKQNINKQKIKLESKRGKKLNTFTVYPLWLKIENNQA